jgi:hypothetical protein
LALGKGKAHAAEGALALGKGKAHAAAEGALALGGGRALVVGGAEEEVRECSSI